MKNWKLILLLLLGVNSLQAQDKEILQADLVKLNSNYFKKEIRVFDLHFAAYDGEETKPQMTRIARYVHNGVHNFYLNKEGSITIYDQGKTLIVDPSDKKILVLNQPNIMSKALNLPTDSMLMLCSSIKLLKKTSKTRVYELRFDSPLSHYDQINLELNTEDWLLSKIVLYYRNSVEVEEGDKSVREVKPRMEIRYLPQSTTLFDTKRLKLSSYVRYSKGDYAPVDDYKTYNIIDNTQTR